MLNERDYEKTLKTIDIEKANRVGIQLMIPVFLVFTVVHVFLWRNRMMDYFKVDFTHWKIFKDAILFFGAFIIGIVLHEIIHGVSFALFARNGFRSIRFGIIREHLTPYCHCTEPLQIAHYRFGGLAPAVLLGLIPAVTGLIIGKYLVTLFGVFFLVAAVGDFMVIVLLKDEKSTDYALDHPSEAGCFVYRKLSKE